MVFHVRWISHHSSPNPRTIPDSGGIRRLVVRKIHLTWKTMENHTKCISSYLPSDVYWGTLSYLPSDVYWGHFLSTFRCLQGTFPIYLQISIIIFQSFKNYHFFKFRQWQLTNKDSDLSIQQLSHIITQIKFSLFGLFSMNFCNQTFAVF